MRGRKRHFTLVELLVVISIIMLLAAMLLPALKKARDTSKGMTCMGNLKQIGTAFMQYCDENEGHMPITYDYSVRLSGGNWTYYFAPYLGLTVGQSAPPPYYFCPERSKCTHTNLSLEIPNNYLACNTYLPNQENGFVNANSFWRRVRKLFKLKKPSAYVSFSERESYGLYYFLWTNETANHALGLRNHANRSNYLHADGHAAAMSIPEPMRGNSMYNWNFHPNGVFENGPIQQ